MNLIKLICCTFFSSLVLASVGLGQSPTPVPVATASPTAAESSSTPTAPSAAPTATVAAAADADDLEGVIRKKIHDRLGATRGHSGQKGLVIDGGNDDSAWIAVPIVGVIFTTLFGAPVLIVTTILFFSFLRNRALHRTVRMMVEKGQPVPPEMFAIPGTPAKVRSDLRRGIILTMVGLGLVIFLAAVNGGFSGGEWAVGVIPLMIGLGYLLVWKLDTPKGPAAVGL